MNYSVSLDTSLPSEEMHKGLESKIFLVVLTLAFVFFQLFYDCEVLILFENVSIFSVII